MRLLGAGIALALAGICMAGPTPARPFGVDDLLKLESFGQTTFDPTGRWLVVERRDAYDTAPRFDYDQRNDFAVSRLLVVDLAHPGRARPLLRSGDGPGYVAGPFSPRGDHIAVYRLWEHHWSLGVVTLATGELRWLGVTPDFPDAGRTLQWRSETELLALVRTDDKPSWPLRIGWQSATSLPQRWAATATGEGSHTVVGSGAYRDLRPRPSPRRLVRIDVSTGAVTTLVSGEFIDLELAPNGSRVALLMDAADLQPHAEAAAQGPWGSSTQQHRLAVLDLGTRRMTRPCPDCDVLTYVLNWSRDGRDLLVFARNADAPWTSGSLRRVNAQAGGVSAPGVGLVTPYLQFRPEIVRTAWMGRDPIVLGRPADAPVSGRLDWYRLTQHGVVNLTRSLPSTPLALAAADPNGLTVTIAAAAWRIDPEGRATRLTQVGVEPALGNRHQVEGRLHYVPPARAWVRVHMPGEFAARIEVIDALARRAPIPLPARGEVMATSGATPAAVALVREPTGQETLWLTTRDAPPVEVAEVNARLADVDPARVRAILHAGPDGRKLTSWLYLPATPAGASRPPPLIIKAYSGNNYRTPPLDQPPVLGLAADVRTLVGQGYAVLVPSLPLPTDTQDPMAGLADRILAVVDAAAAQADSRDEFDPKRLALWGHSYGGYTVMATIAQSSRFKAAVEAAGPTDLLSLWGTFQAPLRSAPEEGSWISWTTGWVENSQGAMGRPPYENPQRYIHNSPVFVADRITTPLLLLHGDQDIIPLGQAEEMFSALYRQNKDAILVTYWGEGHDISSPGNVRDVYRRAFDFLAENLGGPP